MLHIELAHHLDSYARGALSDVLTRGTSADARLTIISVLHTTRTDRPGQRRETTLSTTTGAHAFLLDDHTAIALARGGMLIRLPGHDSFAAASANTIALQRTRHQLTSYLQTAERLVADYQRPSTTSLETKAV